MTPRSSTLWMSQCNALYRHHPQRTALRLILGVTTTDMITLGRVPSIHSSNKEDTKGTVLGAITVILTIIKKLLCFNRKLY